jgi:hypothetical protein
MFNELSEEIKHTLYFGLDLGQSQDYSALAVVDRLGDDEKTWRFDGVHLQRWPLRTSYPSIVADVVAMINTLPKDRRGPRKPVLAIDATGVGAPVVDLFKREKIDATLEPVQIVGGSTVTDEDGVKRIPKRDLVSTVQIALQNRTLKIAPQLPEAATLIKELQNFQVKITDAANDVYGAWREGTHDDLVLAVAMALWLASRPVFRVTFLERATFHSITTW